MSRMIIALFLAKHDSINAVEELQKRGFNNNDVSVITKNLFLSKYSDVNPKKSRVLERASLGSATGAVIGGLSGLLLGLAAVFVPVVKESLPIGMLVYTLGFSGVSLATIAGAVIGVLPGGIIGAKIGTSEELKYLNDDNEVLLSVSAENDEYMKALEILRENNAKKISSFELT